MNERPLQPFFYRFAQICFDLTPDRKQSLDQIVDSALDLCGTPDDLAAIDLALADALSGHLSNAELNHEWKTANSQLWFTPSPDIALQMARRKIAERLKG